MRYFRPIISAFLIAILSLTAQSMAVARGASASAGQVVLCTGTGTVTVNIDSNGEPIGPAHICPDCALNDFVAVLAPTLNLSDRVVSGQAQWAEHPSGVVSAQGWAPSARDPPLISFAQATEI